MLDGKVFKNSFLYKILEFLDIKEGAISKIGNESNFLKKVNYFLTIIQNKLISITKNSYFIKNIDYLILFLITTLISFVPFAKTTILGALTLIIFIFYVLKILVSNEKLTLKSLDIPIIAYITIAGLSVCFSSLFFPSLKGYFKMLIYFGGYLAFSGILKNNPKRVIYILGILAVSVSIEAFIAIFQNFARVEALALWQDVKHTNPEQLMTRVYGTLKPYNPNLLAGYLIAGFSSLLGSTFWFLKRKNWRLTVISLISTVAVLLAIIFTGSRGAYIALSTMALTFTLISGHIIYNDYPQKTWLKRIWAYTIIIGVLGVSYIVLNSPAIQHRITSIFAFRGDSSNSFRFNVYIASFKMFLDNWLIGIGTGNVTFRLTYGLYMLTGYDALGAYSVPLEIAVESGVFCLFSFIWLLFMAFYKGIKKICSSISLDEKIIISTCIIAIAGMMTHGIVDTIWYRPQVNIIFWLYIAILAVTFSKDKFID